MTTPAAAAIRAWLDAHRAEVLAFVETLVGIDSHATHAPGVDAAGDTVCRALESVGYTTERVRPRRLPPEQRWLEEFMLPGHDFDRLADHRVARKAGRGRGRALVLGDLDTAFLPGSPARMPFRIEGDRAIGPGIADMKGGLTVATWALRALEATGLDTLAEIAVVLSSDEQAGSLTARSVIEAAARQADWVFCMECAREGGNLMGMRAQIGVARLDVHGRDAHAGSGFAKGVNAIEAMARKIIAIQGLTDAAREIYLNVGTVQGGWRRSVVPGHCTAALDIRTPGPAAWTEVERAIRKIAEREDVPGSRSTLLIASHRPGVPWTAHTDRLLAIAQAAGRELGLAPFGALRSPAAGSSAFAGPLGVPCMDGMGPAGGDLMTDHEHVMVPSLVERAALLATVLHDLGAGAWDRAR
jgi:glutamate carboxypeptidase